MKLIPYLYLDGQAEVAMQFYADVFGGEVTRLERYSSAPGMQIPDGYENKVLHGSIAFGGNSIYFSDAQGRSNAAAGPICLSVEMDREDALDRAFDKLSQGGKVVMPLAKMFWGAKYGKLVDRFGTEWDLNHQLQTEASEA